MKGAVYKYQVYQRGPVPARSSYSLPAGVEIDANLFERILISGDLAKRMNEQIGNLILEENLWDIALQLADSQDVKVAFRASWGLEWAYTFDPGELVRRKGLFLEALLSSSNTSVLRVYSKMMCDMTRTGAVSLSDDEANRLTEKCFDTLVSEQIPPAVKVWQIELLSDLSARIEWIEEDLTQIVRNMSESASCTPSIAAHARHYFAKLKK